MERQQQFWDVAGVRTCVYDSGPPTGAAAGSHALTVVMLHGGDPRALANALDWSTIWDPAGLGARLIAYDKPGQGLTYDPEMPAAEMGGDGLSAHLEALLDQVEGRVVLAGHSRGALPVADVALRRPDKVAGLVLVSSNTLALSSVETPSDFYRVALADPPEQPTVEYVRREAEMNSFDTGHVDERFVEGRMRAARSNGWWGDRSRREAIYRDTSLPTLKALRQRVISEIAERGFTVPVLQVWGQEDVSAPVQLAADLYGTVAAHTPDAWSLVVNRARHYVYRDRPRAFSAALTAFVGSLAG